MTHSQGRTVADTIVIEAERRLATGGREPNDNMLVVMGQMLRENRQFHNNPGHDNPGNNRMEKAKRVGYTSAAGGGGLIIIAEIIRLVMGY